MSMKHTQEPWEVDDGGDGEVEIWSPSSGSMDAIIGSTDTDDPQWEADARRIVACVNRLAGVEDVDAVEVVDRAELARLRRVEEAARNALAYFDAQDAEEGEDHYEAFIRPRADALRSALEGSE